jgi:hypothetical protein
MSTSRKPKKPEHPGIPITRPLDPYVLGDLVYMAATGQISQEEKWRYYDEIVRRAKGI